MLFGAIIGDIAGSMYEGKRHEIYDDIQFFGEYCRFTDDTIMTCAIAQAIIRSQNQGCCAGGCRSCQYAGIWP